MRVHEWISSYTAWILIAGETRRGFAGQTLRLVDANPERVLCEIDGITIRASLIDGEQKELELMEIEVPLESDKDEIQWTSAVPEIILLSASLEFPGNLSMEHLQSMGHIAIKARKRQELLSSGYPRPVSVYKGDRFEYSIMRRHIPGSKPQFCFRAKQIDTPVK